MSSVILVASFLVIVYLYETSVHEERASWKIDGSTHLTRYFVELGIYLYMSYNRKLLVKNGHCTETSSFPIMYRVRYSQQHFQNSKDQERYVRMHNPHPVRNHDASSYADSDAEEMDIEMLTSDVIPFLSRLT